jgi:hypothetical protein
MATSGHITVQEPHPLHEDWSVTWAGWYPLLLVMLLSSSNTCLGHAMTHISQPLHLSLSTVTLGI